MQLRKFAAGSALAAVVTPAFALNPSDLGEGDIVIDIAGASATENFIVATARTDLCVLGDDHLYLGESEDQLAVFCTMGPDPDPASTASPNGVPGLAANVQVLIRKRSDNGSGEGVGPVCDQTGLSFMKIDATQCTLVSGNPTQGEYSCEDTDDAVGRDLGVIPDAGVSDVGPTEVKELPSSNCQVVLPTIATIFGQPVTTSLRDALQAAQGLTIGSDSEADMPSLSEPALKSLWKGEVQDWNQFSIKDTNNVDSNAATTSLGLVDFVTAYNAANGTSIPVPSETRVSICRRVNSSGTFATTAIKLIAQDCEIGAGSIVPFGDFFLDFTGPLVQPLQGGSSDMAACLTDLNNNAVVSGEDNFGNATDNSTLGGSIWGIGQQSTERVPTAASASSNGYRFIKINGVSPRQENAANGSYPLWVSSTFQWLSNSNFSADERAVLNALSSQAGTPAQTGDTSGAAADRNGIHPWGVAGVAALGANGCEVALDSAGAYDDTLPCIPYTHTVGQTRNCTVPQRAPNAQLWGN